jgi:radical SAM superfamily enzyme YgiQ (UPF0313 family)
METTSSRGDGHGCRPLRVLLVYPRTPDTFWSLKHALRFISKRAAFPPLGLLTVAAMLPRSWQVKLIDENVAALHDDDLRWADYVMVSAMIVHADAVRRIVMRCRAWGRPVIGGGPLFSAGAQAVDAAMTCVVGEAEGLMDGLTRDMAAGRLKPLYQAEVRPDVGSAPLPRWDLIQPRHYATMPVQFSRGCPYDCEFCDIVAVSGRKPRTKAAAQMIAELESLAATGWCGQTFIVDDNFIGNKARVKEFLRELVAWRRQRGSRMQFLTEASVNLADDPELLGLMVEAGFNRVFLGIETPHPASLAECQKRQNVGRDLAGAVRTIQHAGIEVMGGFIVGFDNDPAHVFELQYDFIQRTGIVTAMVGLLTALPQTRLYRRLVREGRLRNVSTGNNTEAVLNFEPTLGREFLIAGYRRLMQSLYEPTSFYQRALTFLAECAPSCESPRLTRQDVQAFIKSLWLLGVCYKGRRAFWKYLAAVATRHASRLGPAISLAIKGHHFRIVANAL